MAHDSGEKSERERRLEEVLAAYLRAVEVGAAPDQEEFLARHPKAAEEPEVRFVLADSLKRLGKNREAQQQVLLLVQSQGSAPEGQQAGWIYWQQRAGNEIANQMYQEGDFVDALEIYSALAALDKALTWEIPVLYQIGLIYERLHQPEKASTTYTRILAREKELALDASLGLKTVVEMAKWRNNFLDWQAHTERPGQTNAQLKAEAPLSAAR